MQTYYHDISSQTMLKTRVDEVDIVEIFGLHVVDLASEFFAEVAEGYKNSRTSTLSARSCQTQVMLRITLRSHPWVENIKNSLMLRVTETDSESQ